MATLTGRSIRTVITNLEIVDETGELALVIQHNEAAGTTELVIRKGHEQVWNSDGPKFRLKSGDLQPVAAAITGSDMSYNRRTLDEIPQERFRTEAPEAEKDPNQPDCSQLDIERARAENLAEEREILTDQFRLDHSRDKHVTADVTGCPLCYPVTVDFDPVTRRDGTVVEPGEVVPESEVA